MQFNKSQIALGVLVLVIVVALLSSSARSFLKKNGKILFGAFIVIAILFSIIKYGKSALVNVPVVGKVFSVADQLVTP